MRASAIGTYGSGASIGSDTDGRTVVRDSVFTSAGAYPALRTEGGGAPNPATIKS